MRLRPAKASPNDNIFQQRRSTTSSPVPDYFGWWSNKEQAMSIEISDQWSQVASYIQTESSSTFHTFKRCRKSTRHIDTCAVVDLQSNAYKKEATISTKQVVLNLEIILQDNENRLGFSMDNNCRPMVIKHVTHGSPAYRHGIRVGDEIIEINGDNVEKMNTNQLVQLVHQCFPSRVVLLKVRRNIIGGELLLMNSTDVAQTNLDCSQATMQRGIVVNANKQPPPVHTDQIAFPLSTTKATMTAASSTESCSEDADSRLERLKRYGQDLQKRKDNEERHAKEEKLLRNSLRGSKKLNALKKTSTQTIPLVNVLDDIFLVDNNNHDYDKLNSKNTASSVANVDQYSPSQMVSEEAISCAVKFLSQPEKQNYFGKISPNAMDCLSEVTRQLGDSISDAAAELQTVLDKPYFKTLLAVHDQAVEFIDRTPTTDGSQSWRLSGCLGLLETTLTGEKGGDNLRIIRLIRDGDLPLGATVKNDGEAIVIGRIIRGGVAEKTNLLHEGDEIIEVNGVDLRGKTVHEVCDLLCNLFGELTFIIVASRRSDTAVDNNTIAPKGVKHIRALFDYNPEEDVYLPCRELGLGFNKGDILHVISTQDPNWWQAYREGEDSAQTLAGLIPSVSFQIERENYIRELTTDSGKDSCTKHRAGLLFCAKYPKTNWFRFKLGRSFDLKMEPFEKEIPTYEEVSLYLSRTGRRRPIVLVGPPHVGCFELRQRLLENEKDKFDGTISHTTRLRRFNERDGFHYHFVSRQEFEEDVLARKFVEWGEYQKHLYGTSFVEIRRVIERGKTCVLTLKPQVSIRAIRNSDLMPFVVFISPPSLERMKLNQRRQANPTLKDDELKAIVTEAKEAEEKYGHYFDLVVVNYDLEHSYQELRTAINRLETEPQWVPSFWLKNPSLQCLLKKGVICKKAVVAINLIVEEAVKSSVEISESVDTKFQNSTSVTLDDHSTEHFSASPPPTTSNCIHNENKTVAESSTSSVPYKIPAWSGHPEELLYNFEVLKQGCMIGRIDLNRPYISFGRAEYVDVQLEHPSISRCHAVFQYRAVGESHQLGWYIFDLGSTHGTFLNKEKIPPYMYMRVKVGHMIAFGSSTRLYILQGPEWDEEPESEFTVTELKQRVEHQKTLIDMSRKGKDVVESKAGSLQKEFHDNSALDRGIDWADYGEDDHEQQEDSEGEESEDGEDIDFEHLEQREQYYKDDPKKVLKKFFDREGHELVYDCSEKGPTFRRTWCCRIEYCNLNVQRLPVETSTGKPVFAEAVVSGVKKDAIFQCALEACRLLDAHGVLRKSSQIGRGRKKKDWKSNDYYDSDEDEFLDRTGEIERKRAFRYERDMKMHTHSKVDNYNTLMQKLESLDADIERTKSQLKLLASEAEKGAEIAVQPGRDSLDEFLANMTRCDLQNVKVKQSQLRTRLGALEKQRARTALLVKVAKPAEMPTFKRLLVDKPSDCGQTRTQNVLVGRMGGFGRKEQMVLPVFVQKLPESTSDKFVEEVEEEEEEEEAKKEEKQDEVNKSVKMGKLMKMDKKPLNKEKPSSSKRTFVEEEEQESENADQPSERRFKRSFGLPYGTGPEEENFSEWLPPDNMDESDEFCEIKNVSFENVKSDDLAEVCCSTGSSASNLLKRKLSGDQCVQPVSLLDLKKTEPYEKRCSSDKIINETTKETEFKEGQRLGILDQGMGVPHSDHHTIPDWEMEKIEIIEEVKWFPPSPSPLALDLKLDEKYIKIGRRVKDSRQEDSYFKKNIINDLLLAKSELHNMKDWRLRSARSRANPFESIKSAIFQNRAAIKLANLDALVDFQLTDPKDADGNSVVPNVAEYPELFYFADVCSGPGGFTEYVLWKRGWNAHGFGMTLRNDCDFRLDKFTASSPEMFEAFYGEDGIDGDGDITKGNNLESFSNFVLKNTDQKGVHLFMADGGFSVVGEENLQEVLSKRIYLCQSLCGLLVLRKGGSFLCKFFDTFTPFTVDLIYLLWHCFDKLTLHKPHSSRPGNSEKYVIGIGFRGNCKQILDYLIKANLMFDTFKADEDIRELLPSNFVQEANEFMSHFMEINEQLSARQISFLKKYKIFSENRTLRDNRQQLIREDCLNLWKIPDESAKNVTQSAEMIFKLLSPRNASWLLEKPIKVNASWLQRLNIVQHLVVASFGEATVLIAGGNNLYYFHEKEWKEFDCVEAYLPNNTVIFGSFTRCYSAAAAASPSSCSTEANKIKLTEKVSLFRIIDAAWLGDFNVENFPYQQRLQLVAKFCKAIDKRYSIPNALHFEAASLLTPLDVVHLLQHQVKSMLSENGRWILVKQSTVFPDYFIPVQTLMFVSKMKFANPFDDVDDSSKEKIYSNFQNFREMFVDRIAVQFYEDDADGYLNGDILENGRISCLQAFQKVRSEKKKKKKQCYLIFLIIQFGAVVRAVCPNGISDEQMLSCLHPIEESWQRIRSRKVSLDKAMLQVLFLSRVETRQLCAKLEQAHLRCAFDFAQCSSSNDALRLVQTGLQFACDHNNPLWHNCTQAVMRNHGQCVLQLTRRDNPTEQCQSLAEFYTCIQEPLQAQCGTNSVAELVKLINMQSCSLESVLESAQSDSRQCEKDDREAVDECFEPLENYWRLLRVKDHKLNTIGFPLYTFRAHELEYMCDTVHQIKASCTAVQRCPSRPIVQFANALLGYACGSEQDAFFAHFQCVRESIQSAGQCGHYLQGAWEPGYHREVCPRMPAFFRCILPQLGRKCSTEAISTLVQTIRQYWCDVGTIADVASAIQDSGIELDDRLALLAFGSIKSQKKVTEVSTEQKVENREEEVEEEEEEVDVNEQHQRGNVDSSNNEDGCAPTRQKRVRDCLAPVFERLVHLHRTHRLENLSLPLYHYGKAEILDLCDLYATAFLQCPFSWFQDCADDAVVSAANSLLGYFCSPQHINAFHEHYDCLSLVIRNRHACSKHLLGNAPGQEQLDHQTNDDQNPKGASISCGGVKQFFNCAKLAVDRGCPQAASNVFKQSLQQFGCQLD
ncbi:MAGUK p55 subfamily member 5 [Trichinella papuae]|uniref:MAGUK p55 subfamily member 5 n=1 Tax=Trichinella papuae TaxID=268474 RepID=A0A0V1MZ41_9BILA|nr:MAGUK p55 subfamily member 5 [Trichinella papuae]